MRKNFRRLSLVLSLIIIMTITAYAEIEIMYAGNDNKSIKYCSDIVWKSLLHWRVDIGVETIDTSNVHDMYVYVNYRLTNDGIVVASIEKQSSNQYVIIKENQSSGDKIISTHRLVNPTTDLAKITKFIIQYD